MGRAVSVAIVSTPLPPARTGQAVMLNPLLKDAHPDQYRLITSTPSVAWLPGRYVQRVLFSVDRFETYSRCVADFVLADAQAALFEAL